MKLLKFIAWTIMWINVSNAQPNEKLKFVDRITLVESLGDPAKSAEPAYVSGTDRKDGTKTYYSAQGGLAVNAIWPNAIKRRTHELNLFVEEHYNSMISKEQSVFQAGLNHFFIINERK